MYRFYLSNFYNTLFQILLVILEVFKTLFSASKEEGISFYPLYLTILRTVTILLYLALFEILIPPLGYGAELLACTILLFPI